MYGMFTYIYHKNQLNVGKCIPYMDPMGKQNVPLFHMTSTRGVFSFATN